MTSPFDIPELTYMIINLLDPKSVIQMFQVNSHFKHFIQDMPIYLELQTCLNYIQDNAEVYDERYNTREKIFISACENACWNIIRDFHTVTDITINIFNESLKRACLKGHLDVIKYLVEKGVNIRIENDLLLRFTNGLRKRLLKCSRFLDRKRSQHSR